MQSEVTGRFVTRQSPKWGAEQGHTNLKNVRGSPPPPAQLSGPRLPSSPGPAPFPGWLLLLLTGQTVLSFEGKQAGATAWGRAGEKQPYRQAQTEFSISPQMAGPFPSRQPVTHASCQGPGDCAEEEPLPHSVPTSIVP